MRKLIVPFLAAFGMVALYAQPVFADDNTVIYLVRHAEKLVDTDPGLTEAGIARAEALANRLQGAGITHIYSTDYKRTRMTAAPTASKNNLVVTLYDPRALTAFTEQLVALAKSAKGNILVVGHSNTTPVVATLLTNTEHPMLNEDQYDHLYVVRQVGDGSFEAKIEYFNP